MRSKLLAFAIPLILLVSIFSISIVAAQQSNTCNFWCRLVAIFTGKMPATGAVGISTQWCDEKKLYHDLDGDGYGNNSHSHWICPQPGYVTNNTDCDDHNNLTHPGAAEICNGINDNCINGIDENNADCSGQTPYCVNAHCVQCLNNANCDDGLYCNGAETCAAGSCQAGIAPSIDDGIPCTIDNCDESSDTITHTADDSLCQNGLWCDGAEICNAQSGCQDGTDPNCADQFPCTIDSCNEGTDITDNLGTCEHDTSQCRCTTDAQCNDGNSCTDDTCVSYDCVNTPNDANSCDDGLWCTINDHCSAGQCAVDLRPVDDTIACTIDSCDESSDQIIHNPDNSLCDDSLYCNGMETCDASLGCQAGIAPNCADAVQCTDDSCDEGNDICVNTPYDSNCPTDGWYDLGNTLWTDDTQCTEKEQKQQEYRDYYCDISTDCQYSIVSTQWVDNGNTRNKPDQTACNDGLFCTINDECTAGLCGGITNDCSDGVACTDDSCDEGNDICVNTPEDYNCPADDWINNSIFWIDVLPCDREELLNQDYWDYYCHQTNGCAYNIIDTRNVSLQYEDHDQDNDGICDVAPAGGGGGGGRRACTEDWVCSDWGDCINGERIRDCSDLNKCGSTVLRPELGEACTVVLPAPAPTPAPVLPAPPTTIIPGPTVIEQLLNNPAFYIGSGALIAAIARLFFLLKKRKKK